MRFPKLPLTDEFLWGLYNSIEKIDDILSWGVPRPWKEVCYLELYRARKIFEKRKSRYSFAQFVNYLKKRGYIKVKSLEPKSAVILTSKGMEKVLRVALQRVEREKRKDGKYLMIVFDIPEKKRKLRDLFRENLKILGFIPFQKSIWISPNNLLKEVQFLIQRYDLEKYVRIFLIEEQEI